MITAQEVVPHDKLRKIICVRYFTIIIIIIMQRKQLQNNCDKTNNAIYSFMEAHKTVQMTRLTSTVLHKFQGIRCFKCTPKYFLNNKLTVSTLVKLQ